MNSVDESQRLNTITLLSIADILRCIFARAIDDDYSIRNECKTYRTIRLTSKRFKTVMDTVNIRYHVLFNCTLIDQVSIIAILQAPKRVIRTFLLIDPVERLREIETNLFRYFKFSSDPTNKLFRYYVKRRTNRFEEPDYKKLWGAHVQYYPNPGYEQLLKLLQLYLGFDEEMKLAYKNAVVKLLSGKVLGHPICRELFVAIGSLLPFTEEELTVKVDLVRYALLRAHYNQECEDKNNIEEEIWKAKADNKDHRLYLDEKRTTFRFLDPILDEKNRNPQYWSEATLRIWRERVCYD